MSEKEILKKIESFLRERKDKEVFIKIKNFHKERVKEIKEDEIHFSPKVGKLIFHLIPKKSFISQKYYDLSVYQDQLRNINLQKFREYTETFNFDGLFYYIENIEKKYLRSLQLYTNGIIETVNCYSLISEEKELYIRTIEDELINDIQDGLLFQSKLGITPPIIFHLAMVDIKGFSIPNFRMNIFTKFHAIDREDLYFSYLLIKKFEIDLEKELKPFFNRIWNACGHPKSRSYDKNGKRIKK